VDWGIIRTRAAIEGDQRGTAACAICYSYAPLSGGGDVPLMLRRLDSSPLYDLSRGSALLTRAQQKNGLLGRRTRSDKAIRVKSIWSPDGA
jgi:hypothetical protein